ncbi:MAG: PA domain-containing protein [Saprospiraceae bacterium]
MMNFTQTNLKKSVFLLVALLLMAGGTLLKAQTHTLVVNTPATVAGNYAAQIASFGPGYCEASADIAGTLQIVSDTAMSARGCGSISTDLTGKIAVIDRGVCGFNEKAYNAQLKGAIAVIIVNNQATPIFSMAAAAPFAALTTIPSFMISQADGNKIKAALAAGVTVNIRRNDIIDSGDVVVWGNQPGQGDFNNGLNGWTSINNDCFGTSGQDTFKTWKWVARGAASRGAFGGTTITSPTLCNGAAAFESDFYDNGGNTANQGGGPCPQPQYGELLSPNIDVSQSNAAGFSLKFYQTTRQFQSGYYVSWSIDGGATWLDTTEINQDLVVNASPFSEVIRVPLLGTAGADSLRVKFMYDANYYYWIIDDVKIIEQEGFNLSVNDFFAVAPNAATPLAHVEPIYFLADVGNRGASAQSNVNLNVRVDYRASQNQPLTQVFTATLPYGTIPANSTIENRVFPQTFTPTQVGTYFVTYSVTSPNADFDTTNNVQQYAFLVTQNLFSKDYNGPAGATLPSSASWEGNEPHAWAWGVHYYVPNAAGNYIQELSFGVDPQDDSAIGQDVLLSVYKWVDDNGDQLASPDERELLGITSYTVTGNEAADRLITVPFPFEGDEPVQLENNTNYLVMVEWVPTDQSDLAIVYSDDLDYAATAAVLGDSTGRYRYAGIIAVGGNLAEEDYAPSGFTGSVYVNIPIVRMRVGATPSSAKDLNKLEKEFLVFPNPTADALNLQLNLKNQTQTATVRMFDISGRLLNQWRYDNVQKERYQYNVSNLSSGTYFLQVVTEEGAGTKKFSVNK